MGVSAEEVTNLAAQMADKMRVDPEDPWGDTINPPPCVYKERCPKTGYLLTLPFETNCPMPEAFVSDNSYLDKILKPVLTAKVPAVEAPKEGADAAPKEGGKFGRTLSLN